MSQSQKPQPTKPTTTYATVTPPSAGHADEETEAILDEIDELLAEEDAFLLTYRQKSGQ